MGERTGRTLAIRDRRDEGKDKVHSSTAEGKKSGRERRKVATSGFWGNRATSGMGRTWATS
jgi:hypothetical protein